MLKSFLNSCLIFEKNNDLNILIYITIKTGAPYDEWDIRKLAKNQGLFCKESFEFRPEIYSGNIISYEFQDIIINERLDLK